MKILKIFGVVVGIHLFALVLIFANPGCSSTTKPTPAPVDTLAKSEPAPMITVPGTSPTVSVPMRDGSPVSSAPLNFNPDAPALLAPAGGGIRFNPTRPNTAAASTLISEPVTDVTPATAYTVKSGDNLWLLAKKNSLTVAELAAANNLKTTVVLHEGQKILIPSKAVTAPAAPTTAGSTKPANGTAAKPASADAVKHTVKSGETLSTIAKSYDVKQSDIIIANNITDPAKIRAGMVLTIPGWQTPTGKNVKPVAKPGATSTKPAGELPKTIFNAPAPNDADSPVKAAPAPSTDVPIIRIDDAPATKKP